jgi:hypothetical protein
MTEKNVLVIPPPTSVKENQLLYRKLIYSGEDQGCQIFLDPKYQNGGKYTKVPHNIPNGHIIFIMVVK